MVQFSKPRVVIIGGGFGGLSAAKNLKKAKADVILIDRANHHVFQPLLYQVATAALSPGDIAIPIRAALRGYNNVQVIMSDVEKVELDKRRIILNEGIVHKLETIRETVTEDRRNNAEKKKLVYDYLILAPGSRHSYFGKTQWEQNAPGLKSLKDALKIREKMLYSFEKAERIYNSKEAKKYLTFVIVGGGPTGVELAGAIAEIGRKTMLPDFPLLKSNDIKIYLLEGTDRLLHSFPKKLSKYAQAALEKLGVTVLLNTFVTNVSDSIVETTNEIFESSNIIWAAGNEASPLLKSLSVSLDKAGRVNVNPDMSIPGYENVFVIGDAAYLENQEGEPIPAIAPAAIQQGKYVAKLIQQRLSYEHRKPFRYFDKGIMATIGRAKAIAIIRKLKTKGLFAWILWCFIHILYLINFRNRFRVMLEWFWYYITFQPGARLIVYGKENENRS